MWGQSPGTGSGVISTSPVMTFRAWGYSDGCGTQSGEVGRKFSKKHGELARKSEISSRDEVLRIRLSWLRLLDSEK